MSEDGFNALIAALDEKKASAESIAQMKAMDFVKRADNNDRDAAQLYMHDAELWRQARSLVLSYRMS